MHPKALLEACTELIGAVLKFDAPADNIVSFFLRQHRELGPRERHTLAEVICDLAAAMIDNGLHEADAPALKAVYNRHSEVDFDTEEQQQLQDFKGLFETVSGMDLGDDDVASHDELLRRADERLQAQAEQSAQRAERKGRARKPSAAQARREEEARQVKQTVREVFRKLVSALHPDRASDAADRDARTAMMQRVNRAYEADDLLALLQLQLEIEQVDLEHVARASAEQVRHFNRVLAEQLAELDAEIADCQARFCAQYGLLAHGRLDPLKLGAVVDDEVRELRAALAVVERDRKALLDRAAAKRWLKKQRRAMRDAYFDDLPF